jgi:tetratricopeptide (TPR) repeat protein
MTALQQAHTHFEAGDFARARQVAMEALRNNPDDVELWRAAGRAGVELGADDAVEQLRKATELQPESGDALHDLGDALLAEGRDAEAREVFRRAVELDPDDELALTQLGHTEFAADNQAAVTHLEKAAERTRGMTTATISLVEMYRALDQPEEALAAACRIAEAEPDDVAAALDVGELSLQAGRLDEALAAFERVRAVYALHGMILAELRRDARERALELAREAARVDQYGRSAAVLTHLDPPPAEEEGAEPSPSHAEVESALAESLREHRRMHAEDRRLLAEDLLG